MKYDNLLVSEHFSSGRRHYFLDFMRASNDSHYIKISRSDEQKDGSYVHRSVVVFEEGFEFLVQSFSYLFHAAAYYEQGEIQVKDLKKRRSEPVSGIKGWNPEERPRERMEALGAAALQNEELIAVLIGSGSPKESAVDLGGRILEAAGNDLRALGKMTILQLCRFSGMGMAKACSIMAAMELGRRMFEADMMDGPLGPLFTKT